MKFRLNSKLLNLFILDISRAFSAAHVSTLTLHQSVRDVVSEIVTDDDDDDDVEEEDDRDGEIRIHKWIVNDDSSLCWD